MGCDIHLYAEEKVDGNWVATKGIDCWLSDYEDWLEKAIKRNDEKDIEYCKKRIEECKEPTYDWVYGGRNYALFALLADVRNDYGITPIDEPRGIPEDISAEIKEKHEWWDFCGHSASWFTLSELKEFAEKAKDYVVVDCGYVGKSEYAEFKENGRPSSWCKGVAGGCVVKICNEVMDDIYKDPDKGDKRYYTWVEWENNLLERTSLLSIIEKLETLDAAPEDVRIVFWFDN